MLTHNIDAESNCLKEKDNVKSSTQDSLLERLPNHLYLARNDNAPDFDRWRLYSTVTHTTYEKFSGHTPEEVMKKYIEFEDNERNKWVNS